MTPVTAEELSVVSSIRGSFEQGAAGAVNNHPNPFFLNLNGSFDLLVAARLVIKNLDAHRAHVTKIAADEAALNRARVKAQTPDPEGA
jgi:hypothetical protein